MRQVFPLSLRVLFWRGGPEAACFYRRELHAGSACWYRAEDRGETTFFRAAENHKVRPQPEKMEMKKRVTLELRHRSPTEVSFVCLVYRRRCGVNLTGRSRRRWGGGEHMASAGPEKWHNVCLLITTYTQTDMNGRVQFGELNLNSIFTAGGRS